MNKNELTIDKSVFEAMLEQIEDLYDSIQVILSREEDEYEPFVPKYSKELQHA